ncbi:hypothetical protein KPNJ1_03566 [Klebsiella pneumoniae 30660/NJST258_1]|uniref:Uncharacterized protein n=1 Tax=Klebsiella pneumoniae 30684/NJST258_2 TaxID=1420013 RepID=W8UKB5_KLEPN|nr:hypothetical protein KPNJ2_03554 [Klebsiella pneumoniae 30684/NJST258_2]AHM85972.1 hypothetical protein KPNJ1_03566 [Klebsiella pneumoniae 30660/NJST258_1]
MYLTELCELNQNSVPPDKGKRHYLSIYMNYL